MKRAMKNNFSYRGRSMNSEFARSKSETDFMATTQNNHCRMQPYHKLIIFCSIILLNACAVPKMFTTLDVLRPAEVTFAPGVKNLLIVNNSVVQPYNIGHNTLSINGLRITSEILKFDSAALFCGASLRENLENKDFFNGVNMAQVNQNISDNYYKITPLSKESVQNLCKLYRADAVLSVDNVYTEDLVSEYDDGSSLKYALDVKVKTVWSLHYPKNISPKFIQFADSFAWEANTVKELPQRYDALVDACILSGSNISDRLIPRWEKQDRYFYTPKNALMQQAMDSVSLRNWNAAIQLWEKAANATNSHRIKFYASNNIAIAYEIIDNLDKALEYTQHTIDLYQNIVFPSDASMIIYDLFAYSNYLKKRKEEVKLLKKQLAE